MIDDVKSGRRSLKTLKPPAVPSLLTSTVPGFGVLHMLQVFRRAQLVFPQPLHVQSPGANMPAQTQHSSGTLHQSIWYPI